MIITKTPYRISFFGGGTDFPEWYLNNGGSVLSTTIDKYCYISCRKLPPFFEHKHRIVYSKIENINDINKIEHPAVRGIYKYLGVDTGLEIHHDGDLPARSGIASSSAFTVGLLSALHCLRDQAINKSELAEMAIHVERNILDESVGCQDQVAVAHGGFNKISFMRNGVINVAPIIMGANKLLELQTHLLLFYTGISRFSSDIEKMKVKNIDLNKSRLSEMERMVDESINILQGDSSILEFGALLDKSWKRKKELSDNVSNEQIDRLYALAKKNGALGGKILGAGGGGFFLIFAPPKKHLEIIKALDDYVHVPFEFEHSGSQVIFYRS